MAGSAKGRPEIAATELRQRVRVVFETPVVLCIFNRPEATRQMLQALRELQPARLMVVADGPRRDRPDDRTYCQQARELVRQAIDWPAKVDWNVAPENLGCRRRIQSGLDWVFDAVESAIILEDDCVPDPSFFPYCRELLCRYRDDARIGIVSGTNPVAISTEAPTSYLFSRYPLVWGWAAWRRTWTLYDGDIDGWPGLSAGDWLEKLLGPPLVSSYWRAIFNSVRQGIDTWDYSLVFSLWRAGLLAIHPRTNLVRNIGFGVAATHTRVWTPVASLPQRALTFPLTHPLRIERDAAHDAALERIMFSGTSKGLLSRARDSIRRGR
jgi:hypothetical protein